MKLKNKLKILQSKEKNSYYKSFPRKSFSNKFLSCNLRTLNWRTCIEKELGECALPGLIFFFISTAVVLASKRKPNPGAKTPNSNYWLCHIHERRWLAFQFKIKIYQLLKQLLLIRCVVLRKMRVPARRKIINVLHMVFR